MSKPSKKWLLADDQREAGLPLPYDTLGWFRLLSEAPKEEYGMTRFELECCRIQDDLRTNPTKYAEVLEKDWIPAFVKGDSSRGIPARLVLPLCDTLTKEDTRAYQECADVLRKKAKGKWKPKCAKLAPSPRMNVAAKLHSVARGQFAGEAHVSPCLVSPERWGELQKLLKMKDDGKGVSVTMDTKKGDLHGVQARQQFVAKLENANAAENCAFGAATPIEIVLGLCVDDGVPNRGHRANIFDASHTHVGCGVSLHNLSLCASTFNFSNEPAEFHVVDPKQLKKVGDRHKRVLTLADFPPVAFAHSMSEVLKCIKCGGEALNYNLPLHIFTKVWDAKDVARPIHTECFTCDLKSCGKVLTKPHVWPPSNHPDAANKREHYCGGACIAEQYDLFCLACKCVPEAAGAEVLGAERIKMHNELAEQVRPKWRRDGVPGDHLCVKCSDAELKAWKDAGEEAAAKKLEEMRKFNEAQEDAWVKKMTCVKCGTYDKDKAVVYHKEKLYHQSCYAVVFSKGDCAQCGKPIEIMDETSETRDGRAIHYACWGAYDAEEKKFEAELAKQAEEARKQLAGGSGAKAAKALARKCTECGETFATEDGELQADKGPVHRKCYAAATSSPCAHCAAPTYSALDGEEVPKVEGKTGQRIGVPAGGYVHEECMMQYLSSGKATGTATTSAAGGGDTSAAGKPCDFCSKDVPLGAGVGFEGKHYHRECFEKSQAADCAHCGKEVPMNAKTSMDGKTFHGDCIGPFLQASANKPAPAPAVKKPAEAEPPAAAPAPTAAATATTTTTTTTTTTVKEDASSVDACCFCDKPFAGATVLVADGKRWHRECRNKSQEAPCHYCGEMITDGSYSAVDGFGKFHGDCIDPFFAAGMKKKGA